jgi:7-cyano-7-deazaguanine synthase
MKKQAVLSLSGGMDSSTLLIHLLSEGYDVTALSFDYGQKHSVELERAQELVNYLNACRKHEDEQYFPKIKYQVIKLDGLSQLLNSALVTGGAEVPEGHYAEENMKATVVPNRNKIFSSIIQSVALSIANEKNTEVKIALGVHSGDHSIYPDCTDDWRKADEHAFKVGNWDSHLVNYYVPYMEGNKFTILEDGLKCCDQLGIDFDEVYKRTNTSYKPIKHIVYYDNEDEYTGEVIENQISYEEWFSDYKSASSVERVEAFIKLGRKDPVKYADEYGPVEWDYVKEFVTDILDGHQRKTQVI